MLDENFKAITATRENSRETGEFTDFGNRVACSVNRMPRRKAYITMIKISEHLMNASFHFDKK